MQHCAAQSNKAAQSSTKPLQHNLAMVKLDLEAANLSAAMIIMQHDAAQSVAQYSPKQHNEAQTMQQHNAAKYTVDSQCSCTVDHNAA